MPLWPFPSKRMGQWTSTEVDGKGSRRRFNSGMAMLYLRCPGRLSSFLTPCCPLRVLGATDPERCLQAAAVKTACSPGQTYQASQRGGKDKRDAQSTELNALTDVASRSSSGPAGSKSVTGALAQEKAMLSLTTSTMSSFAFHRFLNPSPKGNRQG